MPPYILEDLKMQYLGSVWIELIVAETENWKLKTL